MDLREFGFKFYNNTLGLNQRLAHFVQEAGAGCTFCRTFNNGSVLDETFIHLFFYCPSANNILNWLENTFFPDIAFNNRDNRLKFWFFGILPLRNENFSILNLTISQTFLFCIWRCKLQRKIPVRGVVEMEAFYILKRILKSSSFIRDILLNSNLLLCRNWDILSSRRG